jgi:hypothetical protein
MSGAAKDNRPDPVGGREAVERFYERAAWPKGTPVVHPDDPTLYGTLVKRTARNWIDRDRRPPMVRWHGRIDAEEIEWERLQRV